LLVEAALTAADHAPGRMEVVWDPLLEAAEAVACPACGRPSYEFTLSKSGRVSCKSCPPPQSGGKGTKR
jgi:hypothetical protein